MEVCNRRVGPDYLEVHAVAHESASCSTSSWLLERPATMSARPRRMEAMICSSSVISSSEATSGSLLRASITACLSVMTKFYRSAVPKARGAERCLKTPSSATSGGQPSLRPQKIRGKSPKSSETSNPLILGNFAEDCSGSNPDFEVEFRTVREAKAKSSARELRVLQLPLIDGLEGLIHPAFKFAAVAATGKEVDQDLG